MGFGYNKSAKIITEVAQYRASLLMRSRVENLRKIAQAVDPWHIHPNLFIFVYLSLDPFTSVDFCVRDARQTLKGILNFRRRNTAYAHICEKQIVFGKTSLS